jgi:hypothetical protein
MNDDTNQVLTQAYDLIEADQLDEAKAVLEPVVNQEKDNADAWWLYAHAVNDTATARNALQNVLRIDPSYPDAAELLKTLDTTFPSPLRQIGRIERLPDLPPTLPEKLDEEWAEGKPSRRFPRQLALFIPIIVIIVVLGLLVILNQAGPAAVSTPTVTPLEQAGVPTLSAEDFTPLPVDTLAPSTTTEEVAPTDSIAETTPKPETPSGQVPTNNPQQSNAGDPYQPVYDALISFTLPRNSVEVTDTDMGSTLLVSICSIAGPEMRTALPEAMSGIASASESLPADVEAIGARMLNCGNNTPLLVIVVRRDDAVAYANGELTDQEFQALWRSQ